MYNAAISRIKMLMPLRCLAERYVLDPDPPAVEAEYRAIGLTGLYPYVVVDELGQVFELDQFPKSSGYPEDAATVIAAALAFGLLGDGAVTANDRPILVHQGRAMGPLSEIRVRIGFAGGQWAAFSVARSVEIPAAQAWGGGRKHER